jgi:hypothetical protein
MTDNSEKTEEEAEVNISKLKELAIRGTEYREEFNTTYYGGDLTLYIQPLSDLEFLPIAAELEQKMDMDTEEAQELIEEEKEAGEQDTIETSHFDKEFVELMQEGAAKGIDLEMGDAEGTNEDEILGVIESLQGGLSLEIAELVIDVSSNADKAESFRRDGGGE